MGKVGIAILGASKFGRFHAREFSRAGCAVKAILGSTSESAEKTAKMLEEEFGVSAVPFSDLDNLLKEEIEAVSICMPPEMHSKIIRKCLEAGKHVLCEKPLVLDSKSENFETAKELFELANKKGKLLVLDTQLPSLLPYLNTEDVKELSLYFEPGIDGIDMLFDHLPHANSILVKIIPKGTVGVISFPEISRELIRIKFSYSNGEDSCDVEYIMKFKPERPSRYSLSFNGKKYVREIDESYNQRLVSEDEVIEVEDPLKVSIGRFISAIGGGKPLVSENEIKEMVQLQDLIVKAYLEKAE